MDRRTLLKLLGGIAALPALGKAIKGKTGIKSIKAAGKLSTALRLGLSPRVIAGASRFLGIPGLIASTGYSLYDYLSNKESE